MENAFHSVANANADEQSIAKGTLENRFFSRWLPFAIAACLMILGISQAWQIVDLKSQLLASRADATRLRESNALVGLRLTTLEARDVSYASSQIIVAWDSYRDQGVVALQNLPASSAGHDYQLWVLDPAAEAPSAPDS